MSLTPLDRFWAKVVVEAAPSVIGLTPCWWWLGARTRGGKDNSTNRELKAEPYGNFHFNGRKVRAHKWLYEFMLGRKVQAGMDLDHKCEHSLCVNYWHLREVTGVFNKRRANAKRWGGEVMNQGSNI